MFASKAPHFVSMDTVASILKNGHPYLVIRGASHISNASSGMFGKNSLGDCGGDMKTSNVANNRPAEGRSG